MKRFAALALLALAGAAQAQWKYESEKDAMTDKVERRATLASPTKVSLPFPYKGGTVGRLVVWPDVVMVGISRGQIIGEADIDVRFDDGPVTRFATRPSSSGSSTVAYVKFPGFIPGPQHATEIDRADFMARLASAKRVRVQLSLYGFGEQVFEFAPAGLRLE